MKILLEQIMHKKIELSEECNLKKTYLRELWHHCVCYNIARAIVGYKDPMTKRKNTLYKNFLLNPEKIDSSLFRTIQNFMREEHKIIIMALKKLEEMKKEGDFEGYQIYMDHSVGILGYEYPEEQ